MTGTGTSQRRPKRPHHQSQYQRNKDRGFTSIVHALVPIMPTLAMPPPAAVSGVAGNVSLVGPSGRQTPRDITDVRDRPSCDHEGSLIARYHAQCLGGETSTHLRSASNPTCIQRHGCCFGFDGKESRAEHVEALSRKSSVPCSLPCRVIKAPLRLSAVEGSLQKGI